MRSDVSRRRIEMKASPARSIALATTALVIACSAASCDSDSNQISAPVGGGPAVVLRDGSAPDGARNGGAAGGKGGNAGHGGVGGTAGRSAGGAGGVLGAGATGGAGGAVVSGAGGAANGGATQVDACRACVQRRCTNPQGMDDSTTIAYDLCFLNEPVPATPPEYRQECGGDNLWMPVTTAGDHPGTAKSGLCQAVLDCIVRTKCAGPPGTDNFEQCFCGVGVDHTTCSSVSFVPMGACASEMINGYETTSNPAITAGFSAVCLASGAATFAYSGCYESCCSKECLGVDPAPGTDDSTCNAGSSAATGGSTGTGGAPSTGGTTGSGGTVGTGGKGGLTGTGGTMGTGGVVGSGGGSAVAGHGGSTGAAGGSGTGGSGGGAPAPSVSHFDGTTAPWVASYGAVVSYNPADAGGSATSGSLDLMLTNGNASITSVVAATECVSAVAGTTYDLSAHVFLPQEMSGSFAGMALWFYTSPDCTTGLGSTFSSDQVATVGSWQSLTASSSVPAGTQSMSVRLAVTKPAGKTTVEARFDDVSVTKH
ncbi:MAG TPA: hypothetical protein VHO67_02965 [Polyangia bacterium]|nr:hypothetical protein [Polyangia bacterium]